jgi:hypothetical protein
MLMLLSVPVLRRETGLPLLRQAACSVSLYDPAGRDPGPSPEARL